MKKSNVNIIDCAFYVWSSFPSPITKLKLIPSTGLLLLTTTSQWKLFSVHRAATHSKMPTNNRTLLDEFESAELTV